MPTEPSILSILPNLSIGVVSVVALVYVTRQFLQHLKERDDIHSKERREQEIAMRELEKEIRTTVIKQLTENTIVWGKVVTYLEHKQH